MSVRHSYHDVVVVGARCAGAATAMLLARAGHDVVLVDKSHPARDTNSTHALSRGAVVQLARWRLLPAVVASGAPEIRSVAFHVDGNETRRHIKDRAGVEFLLAPRRYILDNLLATAATDAGATLLTDTTVTGLLRDDDGRVRGVATRDADGVLRELHARLVVGADGLYSSVARWVGAETLESHAPSGAAFYTYVTDVPWDGFEFYLDDRATAGVFPTHDDEACVWLIRPAEDLADVISGGGERLAHWLRALERQFPGLAERVDQGSVTAPLRGSVRLPNHRRRGFGPGWALVGDAGYHRDPITGHGITDAFRDAELLAEAASSMLSRRETEGAAMSRYERQRDASLAPIFNRTLEISAFPPKAELLGLQIQLSKDLDAEAQALASRPAPAGDHDRGSVLACA